MVCGATVDERDKVLPRRLNEINQKPRSESVKDPHRSSVVIGQEPWATFALALVLVLVLGGRTINLKDPRTWWNLGSMTFVGTSVVCGARTNASRLLQTYKSLGKTARIRIRNPL